MKHHLSAINWKGKKSLSQTQHRFFLCSSHHPLMQLWNSTSYTTYHSAFLTWRKTVSDRYVFGKCTCWVTKSAANPGNQRASEAVCWHICHQRWALNLTALYLYKSDKQEGNGQVGMGEEINFVSNSITLQEIPWDCFALWSSDYICVPFKYLQRGRIA